MARKRPSEFLRVAPFIGGTLLLLLLPAYIWADSVSTFDSLVLIAAVVSVVVPLAIAARRRGLPAGNSPKGLLGSSAAHEDPQPRVDGSSPQSARPMAGNDEESSSRLVIGDQKRAYIFEAETQEILQRTDSEVLPIMKVARFSDVKCLGLRHERKKISETGDVPMYQHRWDLFLRKHGDHPDALGTQVYRVVRQDDREQIVSLAEEIAGMLGVEVVKGHGFDDDVAPGEGLVSEEEGDEAWLQGGHRRLNRGGGWR